MLTAAEKIELPELSHAFAVSAWGPAGGLVHTKLYGVDAFSPSFVPSVKNSTFTTDPSASDALADKARFPGIMKTAPGMGELNETVGGWFEKFPEPGEMP